MIGFQLFNDQEACSSGGKWSYAYALWKSRIDRSDRKLKIPLADNLHVADVFDGGIEYKDMQVATLKNDEFTFSVRDIRSRATTPPTEKQRTQNVIHNYENICQGRSFCVYSVMLF